LALQSQKTTDNFERDTKEVTKEVQSQLSGYGNFKEQEQRIESLRERIEVSRKKISALGERVDVVKGRVEGWERADSEWQERTRRRLKTFWAVTSIVFFILVLIYLGAPYGGSGVKPSDPDGQDDITTKGLGEVTDAVTGGLSSTGASASEMETTYDEEKRLPNLTRRPEMGSKDERLRVFDEL